MKGHPHQKHAAMSEFNKGHWEKEQSMVEQADGKYARSEMGNPAELKANADALAKFAKSKRMKY